MYNPKLELLNAEISSYVKAAVAKFHNQTAGIRVMDVQIASEQLNPPGIKYIIKMNVQITLDTKIPPVG